jgi:U1 small nuclear ribonucleoprotein C
VFLTHDSTSGSEVSSVYSHYLLTSDSNLVRKAHNSGRNHLANVRDYYACSYLSILTDNANLPNFAAFTALGHDKAQSIIDQITSAYESGGGPPPGGFGGFGGFPPGPPLGGFAGPPPGFGGPPPPIGFGAPPPGFGGREFSPYLLRYC